MYSSTSVSYHQVVNINTHICFNTLDIHSHTSIITPCCCNQCNLIRFRDLYDPHDLHARVPSTSASCRQSHERNACRVYQLVAPFLPENQQQGTH